MEEYSYVYTGGSLMQMVVKTTTTPVDGEATTTTETLNFSYDASGVPLAVDYNGTDYYYVTNIQGDIMAILDTAGNAVVEYAYDAWGNIHSVTGSLANTLGEVNPLTYRGYVYDQELGLYYLQSRYYDPEVGRFINADGLVATGQGLLGNNMFAYCNNSPVTNSDPTGEVLIGAMLGGAIGGALISTLSHLGTNPNATLGSTLGALAVGAITGAIGGVAGVVNSGKGIISLGAGIIAGVYAGATAPGTNGQKILTGITTGIIATAATYCGSKIDTSGFDRIGTAEANFCTTVYIGAAAEFVSIHVNEGISKPILLDYGTSVFASDPMGGRTKTNTVYQFA